MGGNVELVNWEFLKGWKNLAYESSSSKKFEVCMQKNVSYWKLNYLNMLIKEHTGWREYGLTAEVDVWIGGTV